MTICQAEACSSTSSSQSGLEIQVPNVTGTCSPDVTDSSCQQQLDSPIHNEAPRASLITDNLGRKHFKVPHTGPAAVFIHAARFHSSTIQSHVNDLKPMVEAAVQQGKTVMVNIVDGGPDWSTASLLNALFLCICGGIII